ncbi:MAG: tRNA (adenosine(37)-N6)-dimethylallyltransferase MiaA [Aureliella sp.]
MHGLPDHFLLPSAAHLMTDTHSASQAVRCHPPLEACYLTGPPASGKTPLGLEIAQRLNAEIVSLDSMAIYRGMDIGTAKPSAADRQRVRHHMLDIVDPTETYSVSCYVEAAHRTAAEIASRGKRVLFVGGTPLYLKSLLRGMFLGPPADSEFRRAVEADVAEYGLDSLRQRLIQVDPLLAHKLHSHDQRRMIRALEVAMLTGRPLSHWQTQFETPSSNPRIRAAVIGLDRGWLHQRINTRVEQMIAAGLEREVRDLAARFGTLSPTAAQAVGYREMLGAIADSTPPLRGRPLAETIDEIKAHTRQFARRQEIWFRGLKELQRFELTPETELPQLADRIAQWYNLPVEPTIVTPS